MMLSFLPIVAATVLPLAAASPTSGFFHRGAVSLAGRADSDCGVVGYDEAKPKAYWKVIDPEVAKFNNCRSSCTASAKCVSFATGSGACLLYSTAVAENVRVDSRSPFTFYSANCTEEVIHVSNVNAADSSNASPTSGSSSKSTSSNAQATSSSTSTSSSGSATTSAPSDSGASSSLAATFSVVPLLLVLQYLL